MCDDFACVLKSVLTESSSTRALTRVVEPEKVASRIGQISTQPHSLLARQMGMF